MWKLLLLEEDLQKYKRDMAYTSLTFLTFKRKNGRQWKLLTH